MNKSDDAAAEAPLAEITKEGTAGQKSGALVDDTSALEDKLF